MSHPSEFNPLAAETVECPYPFYQAMRDEQPVYEVPGAGFFIVSRYQDILYVLNHEEIFSSMVPPGMQAEPDDEVIEIMKTGYLPVSTLLTNDPPSHTRYRSLVNKAFSARRMAQLEPSIRLIAKQLIDAFVDHGKCELVSQFAVGLPLSVIADALGVSRADLPRFKKWSDDSVAPLGGMITHQRQLECARSVVEFQHYFAGRLEERRSSPRHDILSDLIKCASG
jgi:cytochrome P450